MIKGIFNKIKSAKYNSYISLLIIFYAAGSILINLMAIRTFGKYDGFTPILQVTTAGSLISWLVFAAIDVITEVCGKKKAIQTFWMVGIINVVLTIIAALACLIPGTPGTNDAYITVFGFNWGIALASIIAFILGNYANTIIMYVMKTRASDPKSGKGFTLRVIVSTAVGQFIDNAFFYILALAPVFGIGGLSSEFVRCASWGLLFEMVGFTTLIELGVEVIFSPLFHKFSQFLIKKNEVESLALDEEIK